MDASPIMEPLVEVAKDRAKDIYDDAIKPAAKEAGKSLQTVLGTLNVLLSPLEELRTTKYKHQHLVQEMRSRVTDIPENKLKSLPLYISGPAMEGLRFAMDVPELREMYMGLLASAINADTAECVLPSYAGTIKQLSPDEARIIKALPKMGFYAPLVDVDIAQPGRRGSISRARNLSAIVHDAQCRCLKNAALYIENLCRLGLCRVDGYALAGDERYESIFESEEYKEAIKDIPNGFEAEAVKKCFGLTEYGARLKQVCWGMQ